MRNPDVLVRMVRMDIDESAFRMGAAAEALYEGERVVDVVEDYIDDATSGLDLEAGEAPDIWERV